MSAGHVWFLVAHWTFLIGALACGVATAMCWNQAGRKNLSQLLTCNALVLTAIWCVAGAAFGGDHITTSFFEVLRNLAWLGLVWAQFHGLASHTARTVRVVIGVLIALEICQAVLIGFEAGFVQDPATQRAVYEIRVMLHLLAAMGLLVVIHNMWVYSARLGRTDVRWLAAGLGAVALFEFNYYLMSYLIDGMPVHLSAMRGIGALLLAVPLALSGSFVGGERNFRPSRSVTFQSLTFLVALGYMAAMVALARVVTLLGGDVTRLTQFGFVAVAGIAAALLLPSARLRGWLRVMMAKHLFAHRYDYRAEWLRFAETIGQGEDNGGSLHERTVKAIADITGSRRGILLIPDGQNSLDLAARWNWSELRPPTQPLPASAQALLEQTAYVVDLDEPAGAPGPATPTGWAREWLAGERDAWALVPLVFRGRLLGLVLLSRPSGDRRLDWEDLDLLRVVGQQTAGYLAEHASEEALVEASRFDEFNRRMAFVMHDIKNLASQLALLSRNAEKHADNPAFREDMLVTLRASSEKLQALLARLGQYGGARENPLEDTRLDRLVRTIRARFRHQRRVIVARADAATVRARPHDLEQAVAHLVQNAIEASADDAPVMLGVTCNSETAELQVVDNGHGMSPEFVRRELFSPFRSSKPGGFGIGAFEARELVRAMGGTLEVESRQNVGTTFRLVLPLANADEAPPAQRNREAA